MKAVLAYVRAHPGCCKADVQRGTGAGPPSIDRAIAAGLIGALWMDTPPRRYRLYAASAGGPGRAADT